MPCPSARRGAAQAPEQTRHRRGGPWGGARGQPPALLERCSPRGRARAAGGTRVYRSTRAVLWFHFGIFCWKIYLFFFFFLEHQQHEEEGEEDEEAHPASTLIWNQKLCDVVWVSDGISPPGATVGVLPPPSTHSRVRHRAGDPSPQMPPGTAASPLQEGSVLIQGTEGTGVLSCLFLTLQFCLDRKLKAKNPDPIPIPLPQPATAETNPEPSAWDFSLEGSIVINGVLKAQRGPCVCGGSSWTRHILVPGLG